MTITPTCESCHNTVPRSAHICPHCGVAGDYPNVRDAKAPEEEAALERRYLHAKAESVRLNVNAHCEVFENTTRQTRAAIACSANQIQRLATSDDEIYATYYEWIEAGARSHVDDKWSILRDLADGALFPGYKKDIRFAALTLDDRGVSNYGPCSILLRTGMIAHRATVFEENSTVFMEHQGIKLGEADHLPCGYRATWENRHKLCLAKLYNEIREGMGPADYAAVLIKQGATTGDDQFIEVHIWGPLTARTMEQVTINPRKISAEQVIAMALEEKLGNLSVKLKVG